MLDLDWYMGFQSASDGLKDEEIGRQYGVTEGTANNIKRKAQLYTAKMEVLPVKKKVVMKKKMKAGAVGRSTVTTHEDNGPESEQESDQETLLTSAAATVDPLPFTASSVSKPTSTKPTSKKRAREPEPESKAKKVKTAKPSSQPPSTLYTFAAPLPAFRPLVSQTIRLAVEKKRDELYASGTTLADLQYLADALLPCKESGVFPDEIKKFRDYCIARPPVRYSQEQVSFYMAWSINIWLVGCQKGTFLREMTDALEDIDVGMVTMHADLGW